MSAPRCTWYELGDKIPAIPGALGWRRRSAAGRGGRTPATRCPLTGSRAGRREGRGRGHRGCRAPGRPRAPGPPLRVVTTVEPMAPGTDPTAGVRRGRGAGHRMVVSCGSSTGSSACSRRVHRRRGRSPTPTSSPLMPDDAGHHATLRAGVRAQRPGHPLRPAHAWVEPHRPCNQRLGDAGGLDPARPPIVLFADLNRFKQLKRPIWSPRGGRRPCRVATPFSRRSA